MVNPVKWAILGAGKFARQQMGPAIHAASGADLVAIGTSSAEKAAPFEAFAPGLRVLDGYDAVLADAQVEAVYIPLPNHLHIEWARKAIEAGKHVLVEKPVALSAEQIDPLIALRDKTGLHIAEAYMIVHHPQWIRAREIVQSGALGQLVHVEGIFTYNNAADPGNVRNDATKGGGGIPDIGVYTYGATRFVTGQEPLEITHADLIFENGVDVISQVSARFDGFTAHWVNSMRMHPFQEMVFIGDAGWMRLSAPFNPLGFGEAVIEVRADGTETTERFSSVNQYVLQVEAFGRTVRTGETYPWTLEDARGTQRVIDAVYAKAAAR